MSKQTLLDFIKEHTDTYGYEPNLKTACKELGKHRPQVYKWLQELEKDGSIKRLSVKRSEQYVLN